MKRDKGRIAIFISYSGQGGVERMVNNLARGLLDAGYSIDLVLARATGDHIQDVPEGVRQIRLGTRHTYTALPGLASYLRREKPASLLAVKDRAIRVAILARWLSGRRPKLAGRIGTTVTAALKGKGRIRSWGWRAGMRLFYRHTDRIIAVSEGVAEDIRNITGLPEEHVRTVHNPVISPLLETLAGGQLDHGWFNRSAAPVILGIGRLTYQKDFTTLVRAFHEVRKTRDCRLVILGEGGQRREIESLTAELGITAYVELPGFVPNPYPWLAGSSLFVLSSRWEGSPNALTEALALGIPVVSTDCPSGPREILQSGRYGSLVPIEDPEAMATAILKTLEHPPEAKDLKQAAAGYHVEKSVQGYLEAMGLPGS